MAIRLLGGHFVGGEMTVNPLTGLPSGLLPCPLTDVLSWSFFLSATETNFSIIHSKMILLRFCLAQIPRKIFYNQLALTKFGRCVRYLIKWRQWCKIIIKKTRQSRSSGDIVAFYGSCFGSARENILLSHISVVKKIFLAYQTTLIKALLWLFSSFQWPYLNIFGPLLQS